MKSTRLIMGMPITVEVIGERTQTADLEKIFAYFTAIDERFSPYKPGSEVSRVNRGMLDLKNASGDMRLILDLAERTKRETEGYFDVYHDGKFDPSGLVKGWAIKQAADLLAAAGFSDFYVEAGGDVQVSGRNASGRPWQIGIKNPFNQKQIVKTLSLGHNEGLATSGTYIRGQHIYNPKQPGADITDIVSLTVIGQNVYEADRFATACFAMGKMGIYFLEKYPGLEGYIIDKDGMATMTTGFEKYQ